MDGWTGFTHLTLAERSLEAGLEAGLEARAMEPWSTAGRGALEAGRGVSVEISHCTLHTAHCTHPRDTLDWAAGPLTTAHCPLATHSRTTTMPQVARH